MEQFPIDRFSSALRDRDESRLRSLVSPEAWSQVRDLLHAKYAEWSSPALTPYVDALLSAPDADVTARDVQQAIVSVEGKCSDEAALESSLKAFCPWKKGPYRVFGHEIDAEWRSDQKWERLRPHFSSLQNKVVADIGCHNGYFMFRMMEDRPAQVIGIEPFVKNWLNFLLLNKYLGFEDITFAPLGVEHMQHFPGAFDTIFCLGILYHHTDPVGLLRGLRESLRKGGELIIDCQGIPGSEPVSLTPAGRYAKARGIWFLPTASCLTNWIKRAGFGRVELFYGAPLATTEQRRTPWADVDSLAEFLSPDDTTCTIEGYPAPYRYYVKAQL